MDRIPLMTPLEVPEVSGLTIEGVLRTTIKFFEEQHARPVPEFPVSFVNGPLHGQRVYVRNEPVPFTFVFTDESRQHRGYALELVGKSWQFSYRKSESKVRGRK